MVIGFDRQICINLLVQDINFSYRSIAILISEEEQTKERHHASVHNRCSGNHGSDFSGPGFGRGYLRRPAPTEWQMLVLGTALIPE
jgi:hypothetical protein